MLNELIATLSVVSALCIAPPGAAAGRLRDEPLFEPSCSDRRFPPRGHQGADASATARKLADPDRRVRLEGLRELAGSEAPEAPLHAAALLNDAVDAVQIEAIATVVGFFVDEAAAQPARVRDVATAFAAGSRARNARPVPPEVVAGLATAMRDSGARVRLDAMYAYGTVAAPLVGRLDAPARSDAIDALARGLADREPRVRLGAARVLGRLLRACDERCGDARTAGGDALMSAMHDRQPDVRHAAMASLGAMREGRAAPALIDRYARGKGADALVALDALAQIGDTRSVPLFTSLLTHENPTVRRLAIEGVGRAGVTEVALTLETMPGTTRSEEVALAVSFALHRLERAPRVDTIFAAALREPTADQAFGYLLEMGASIAPALYAFLRDPDPRVSALAAEILGESGDPGAIEQLAPLATSQDTALAAAARRAIGKLKRLR